MMTKSTNPLLPAILGVAAITRAATCAVTFTATTAVAQSAGPATQQAPTTIQGGTGESLSSKLNKSGGVIAPKSDVDPGIHTSVPDPQPGSTPIIPPSATGGGSAK